MHSKNTSAPNMKSVAKSSCSKYMIVHPLAITDVNIFVNLSMLHKIYTLPPNIPVRTKPGTHTKIWCVCGTNPAYIHSSYKTAHMCLSSLSAGPTLYISLSLWHKCQTSAKHTHLYPVQKCKIFFQKAIMPNCPLIAADCTMETS